MNAATQTPSRQGMLSMHSPGLPRTQVPFVSDIGGQTV